MSRTLIADGKKIPCQVNVETDRHLSAVRQLGKTIQKKEGKRWMTGRRFAKREKAPEGREVAIRAHQITIPARPFLGVSREDERPIMQDAEDWLMRG